MHLSLWLSGWQLCCGLWCLLWVSPSLLLLLLSSNPPTPLVPHLAPRCGVYQHLQHHCQRQHQLCQEPRVWDYPSVLLVICHTSNFPNPRYPSSYTPTNTGSCVFTISKVSSDVCQLRLDFQVTQLFSYYSSTYFCPLQTFSGLATSSATVGDCTDYLTASG